MLYAKKPWVKEILTKVVNLHFVMKHVSGLVITETKPDLYLKERLAL